MELTEITIKMRALRNQVAKWLEDNPNRHIAKNLGIDFNLRYTLLYEELVHNGSPLFYDLPNNSSTNPIDNSPTFIGRDNVVTLLRDIEYCLDLLTNIPTIEIPSMKITREGVFFAGQYFDALQRIAEILSKAKLSIIIIDGYIDGEVLNLLTAKQPTVEVKILTKAKSIKPALTTASIGFNKQYKGLSIRTSETFHDRFVIVDDHDFFHFGASIKDLGNRGFMFSLIEEAFVIDALRKQWITEWANAPIIV